MAVPSSMQPGDLLLLILGSTVCLVAGFIFAFLLRSRRKGDTPYCRKCDYNLTGLKFIADSPSRCPECGIALSGRRVVRGVRVRRPLAFASAILVLIVGLTLSSRGLFPVLADVNWYAWKPGDFVIHDLDSNDSVVVQKAVYELGERLSQNRLWFWQRTQLIQRSLDVQAQRVTSIMHEPVYLEWLGVLAARDQLSPKQREEFLKNSFAVTIAARPQALARFGIPIRFDLAWRGPYSIVRGSFRVVRLTCDEREIPRETLGSLESGRLGEREVFDWLLPETLLGEHALRAELEFAISASGKETPSDLVAYSELRSYEMRARVSDDVPPQAVELAGANSQFHVPASPVEIRKADSLLSMAQAATTDEQKKFLRDEAAALKAGKTIEKYVPEITLHGVYLTQLPEGKWLSECGVTFSQNSAIGLAFDVVVKANRREYVLGSVAQLTYARWNTVYYVKLEIADELPATVSVILRPSRAAAMMTFDLTRIYPRDIQYDDVPVMRRAQP